LSNLPEGKQHGLAAWLASRLALFEGQLDECREHARRAQAIAARLTDPDLHCLGLVYQGHIFIAQSEVRHGLSLHDEAGAAALAGRVSPWVGGIVFCSVIWAYLHLGDHHRAGQWTDEFTRWCERHASYCYPALCRLHRSEILAIRGELASAEQEVRRAREQLAASGPFCEGDACRVLGEIRLALGDLDGAEAAFREAYRLGWNPQPGLALLLAARGEPDAALKQLERALAQPTWTDGQRRGSMLAVLARVAAMNGQRERAEAALAELEASPDLFASHASAAERERARGELSWAKSDVAQAELSLRDSVADWLAVGAPLQAAEVRLRLCQLLAATGDRIAAELELGAAETEFRRVEAAPLLAQCQSLRDALHLT
jgi:ATP/maltotriose-dependent transcriptional regulator MalT